MSLDLLISWSPVKKALRASHDLVQQESCCFLMSPELLVSCEEGIASHDPMQLSDGHCAGLIIAGWAAVSSQENRRTGGMLFF